MNSAASWQELKIRDRFIDRADQLSHPYPSALFTVPEVKMLVDEIDRLRERVQQLEGKK